ncbi:g8733 [Coccomyxa viridis]|uniref:G8733 protein n=1 Tax=Coccomyxa viridis TaxID=1274662 RepID=A0ABP1G7G7_9CHLO
MDMEQVSPDKVQQEYRDTGEAKVTAQPTSRIPTIAFLPPPALYNSVIKMGEHKAETPWWKTLLLGILAGVYVSFAGALSYTVGGEVNDIRRANPGVQKLLFGAFGVPFGLALIIICGADLFTANTCFMTAAYFEGKVKSWHLVKNWVAAFLGNLAGALFIVWLVDRTLLFREESQDPSFSGQGYAQETAVERTSAPWGAMVVRGVLANWLMSLAYLQAMAAQDIIGRIVGVYLPSLAFEAIELNHVVVDMFLVPFGMKNGAPVSVGQYIWRNMIPVAIGNTIAGCFFVALPYSILFGSLGEKVEEWAGRAKHGDILSRRPKKEQAQDGVAHEGSRDGAQQA